MVMRSLLVDSRCVENHISATVASLLPRYSSSLYFEVLLVVEEADPVWREGVGLLHMTSFDLWPTINFSTSMMSK